MESHEEYLPVRIMKMIKELHFRGYNNLYLFSGMSPSGSSWRYIIGLLYDNKWPTESYLVRASTGPEGDVEWSGDNSTVKSLSDGFERYFFRQLTENKCPPNPYSIWYDQLIDSLGHNELLIFFTDGPAEKDYHPENAPGFDPVFYSRYS